MNRSIGVTFIGVLSLIGSVLMLGMAVMMVAIAVFSPRTDTNIPPGVFLILMVVCSIFYAMLAAWGISTSIGLFRLKNWARISIIIFSVLLTLMSTISGLMALTIPLPPTAGTPVDPNAMLIFRMVMGIFWAVQMGIGIWWLVFFTRAKVKAQFVPPALPKTLPQGAGYSLQKANLQVPPANPPPAAFAAYRSHGGHCLLRLCNQQQCGVFSCARSESTNGGATGVAKILSYLWPIVIHFNANAI